VFGNTVESMFLLQDLVIAKLLVPTLFSSQMTKTVKCRTYQARQIYKQKTKKIKPSVYHLSFKNWDPEGLSVLQDFAGCSDIGGSKHIRL